MCDSGGFSIIVCGVGVLRNPKLEQHVWTGVEVITLSSSSLSFSRRSGSPIAGNWGVQLQLSDLVD